VTRQRKSLASSALELAVIVGTAVLIAIGVQAFVIKPYKIPSGSMEPTLHVNQRILVDRIGTHFGNPQVGDIIVFHPPASYTEGCANSDEGAATGSPDAKACDVVGAKESSETFVKRVVGVGGDRISIAGGHVIRNGVREQDAYIATCAGAGACDFRGTITVPKGDYFMMGDNRGESDDSRFWGPIPRKWIIGQAFFTYWPPDRLGFL